MDRLDGSAPDNWRHNTSRQALALDVAIVGHRRERPAVSRDLLARSAVVHSDPSPQHVLAVRGQPYTMPAALTIVRLKYPRREAIRREQLLVLRRVEVAWYSGSPP